MPSRLRDIREVTRTEVLATKSSRDVARDTTCRDHYPVPEQSFNCSRGSMSILHEHEPTNARVCELQEPVQTHMPKLHYADIVQPISTMFPRVNLEKFMAAEAEMWRSIDLPTDALRQVSRLAHKSTIQTLVDEGKDLSTRLYTATFTSFMEDMLQHTRKGVMTASDWIQTAESPSSYASSMSSIACSRKQEVVVSTTTSKSLRDEKSRPQSIRHANDEGHPRRSVEEVRHGVETTTKYKKFEGEEPPPRSASRRERQEAGGCRESTTTSIMRKVDYEHCLHPIVECREVKPTTKPQKFEGEVLLPLNRLSRRSETMAAQHVDERPHPHLFENIPKTDESKPRRQTELIHGFETTKEHKFRRGRGSPPIESSRRESTIHEKDETPHPSQIQKSTRADRSTWWRSGWRPAVQSPCPASLRRSTFGGNWA